MDNEKSPRRQFIKSSVAGLAVSAGLNEVPDDQQAKLNVVCVGAHPGDPEFGCGGTMARYADAGHSVTLLYITRGEASDPSKSHEEMATLRTKEASLACSLLKTKPLFFGQIDGDTVLDKTSHSKFDALLKSLNPDILFSQWPIDSHGDHQVAGQLALSAWSASGRKFHLYFYEVNTGTETMEFTPTAFVDITKVGAKKKEAMFAHKTQDPITIYREYFEPLERFRGLQAGCAAAEAFIHFKPQQDQFRTIGL